MGRQGGSLYVPQPREGERCGGVSQGEKAAKELLRVKHVQPFRRAIWHSVLKSHSAQPVWLNG